MRTFFKAPKEERETNPYQEAAKKRASDYRKEQYQKLKTKKKEERVNSRKTFPEHVMAALAYFELNGFPMPAGPKSDTITEAKRTLSRVFHPDRGGTNEEFDEMIRNCEVLSSYLMLG